MILLVLDSQQVPSTATAHENTISENREGAGEIRGSPSKDPHGSSSFCRC